MSTDSEIDSFRKKVAPRGTEWIGNFLSLPGETAEALAARKASFLQGQALVVIEAVADDRFPDIHDGRDLARAYYPHSEEEITLFAVYARRG